MHTDIQVNLTYLFGLGLSLMPYGSVIVVSECSADHTLVLHAESLSG